MIRQRFLAALLVLVCLVPTASASYSTVVVFGDSLSDNGNLYTASGGTYPPPPYYNGRRSDGLLAVEYLATSLGASLVDFAWIGATTGVGNYGDKSSGGSVTSLGGLGLPGMSTTYAAAVAGGAFAPFLSNGLFVVWGGPNDYLAPSPLDGDPAAIIARAVANEVAIITDLKLRGAKTILAPGMVDLGLTPDFVALGSTVAAQATAFTEAFNAALLAALPADVLFFDSYSLVHQVVSNPAAYGLTNVTDPCFDGATVCANPSQYLFFDGFHPTTAAHAILAQGFLSVVPEPATWLLLGAGLLVWRRRAA